MALLLERSVKFTLEEYLTEELEFLYQISLKKNETRYTFTLLVELYQTCIKKRGKISCTFALCASNIYAKKENIESMLTCILFLFGIRTVVMRENNIYPALYTVLLLIT
jgi:hypothetical protein